MIKYFNGIPVNVENTITQNNDDENYHVSYNPSSRDYGVDTTALVITIGGNERNVFYILKGNHTAQYETCSDLKACVRYFVDNQALAHKMGDVFEHDHIV